MMGIWSFFFGRRTKKDPIYDYFEDEWLFRPSGEKIGLTTTAPPSGPTQRQKDFFARVENDYLLIVAAISPIIENEFRNWKPGFRIVDFEREFKLAHLDIPTCEGQPIEWEITFDTVHDLNHIVTVGMLGYEPQYVRVDG